ncbi:MAG: cytochrome ubiquinol oxidase subunit I [Propionibacteriaceae bacterium]|jgi:cytochrome d ubiquinol oxidase subunit I|nr:cytochrome ubiquinol oxidase subunit I [Propionibacteriaceae bacterium]
MTEAAVLARWQFGVTTVYHFFFVPITISMALIVAVLQTLWTVTANPRYLRLTKFFGKLFLINFAMGVVTGIVQEFQFGLSWSEYSRFVGDIFGAPLAMEALISFFLESTFLGLWIFGWDKLNKYLHLATIWLAALGSSLSAVFILIANSWMQNPVGAHYNPVTKRAEVYDFMAVLTNPLAATVIPHVLFGAMMVGSSVLLGVCGWWLAKLRRENPDGLSDAQKADDSAYRFGVRFGAIVAMLGFILTFMAGHEQGQLFVSLQPMKVAAQEDVSITRENPHFPGFAVIAWPNDKGNFNTIGLDIEGETNKILTGSKDVFLYTYEELDEMYSRGVQDVIGPDGQVIQKASPLAKELKEKDPELYNAYLNTITSSTGFVPNVLAIFYSSRLMMIFGAGDFLFALIALIMTRKKRSPKSKVIWTGMMTITPLLPLFAASLGWITTEMGRQAYIVYGVLPTGAAVSPGLTVFEIATSLTIFTIIYGVGAVVEVGLFLKTVRSGLPDFAPPQLAHGENQPMSFAY